MQSIQYDSYEALCRAVAAEVAQIIRTRGRTATAWPTGSTPVGVYRELVKAHTQEGLDFSKVLSFNLDEYVGLPATNANSFYYFLNQHLYSQVNIARQNIHWFFDGETDPAPAVAAYGKKIEAAGGFDFLLLGIGSDGHIAFNMPGTSFSVGCDVVELSEQAIQANARFFTQASEVPRQAVTIGMRDIMQAQRVILMATGPGKREVVDRLRQLQRADPALPASILLLHPNCTLAMDGL